MSFSDLVQHFFGKGRERKLLIGKEEVLVPPTVQTRDYQTILQWTTEISRLLNTRQECAATEKQLSSFAQRRIASPLSVYTAWQELIKKSTLLLNTGRESMSTIQQRPFATMTRVRSESEEHRAFIDAVNAKTTPLIEQGKHHLNEYEQLITDAINNKPFIDPQH